MSDRELSDDKWVRVMADYCSEALWAKDGAGVGPDELPVTDDLKERLAAWQHRFDDECEDYLPECQRTTTFDAVSFSKEGLAIALAIKEQLPDWTVIYFDEARSNNVPALDYEYEVRLPLKTAYTKGD